MTEEHAHNSGPGYASPQDAVQNAPREEFVYVAGLYEGTVTHDKYGHRIHIWDLEKRTHQQTIDLGEAGLVPLEVRWLHDPDATQGYVAATLSSTLWHVQRNGAWSVDRVVEVDSIDLEGWPIPVSGLITDQNSLYSTWDNQFYPDLESWLLKVDLAEDGTMTLDENFYVDFSALPGRPRAHEIHLPGGDVTTEIFS